MVGCKGCEGVSVLVIGCEGCDGCEGVSVLVIGCEDCVEVGSVSDLFCLPVFMDTLLLVTFGDCWSLLVTVGHFW